MVERLVLRERATGAHCVDVHCAYNVPRARAIGALWPALCPWARRMDRSVRWVM